jgi:Rad3-related DNA helicase
MSAHQALRCGVRSAPEPDAPHYPAFIANALDAMSLAFGKNILVLFTANAMLTSVYTLLKKSPAAAGRTLLAQNLTGARHTLVSQLKQNQNVILMGTDSFWEGIDAPGEACEIVVIPRLPFSVPTHPLTRALAQKHEEQDGDSFFSYTIPEAIIRFKQGAGRLLRRRDDRGVLVVLDNRIMTKGYGKQFARSLEGEFTPFGSVDEMIAGMKGFFENIKSGSDTISESKYVPFDEL